MMNEEIVRAFVGAQFIAPSCQINARRGGRNDEHEEIVRAFVGAQFIAPSCQVNARRGGRNELRPYISPFKLRSTV